MTCLLGSVLLARWLRTQMNRRHGMVQLTYPGNRVIHVPSSTSVLEASRMAGIRHASICGGRGRCSTCRIHVVGDASCVPPPSEQELQVLKRVGASPNVRLACQLRPSGAVTVTPLLPPTATVRDGLPNAASEAQGNEREIAILFADIRGFTRLAEHKLPYDVVFLLNRYFAEMGRAVELNGGYVDKFIGDGVMALFGLHADINRACRQAVDAAAAMSLRMVELNRAMAADLAEPLRIGIGIHSGTAIVGEMGFGRASSMTAIGDAVNTASRLESQCKDHGCELVVSEIVMERAGLCYEAYPRHEVEIRGRQNKIVVYAIDLASQLQEIEAGSVAQPA
jgi:adenylate cyclase